MNGNISSDELIDLLLHSLDSLRRELLARKGGSR